MLLKHLLAFAPLALSLSLFAANDPEPTDDSRAGIDGPHVFYRGTKIVVKSVEKRDTGMAAATQVFENKTAVTLTCNVPETGDRFSFPLHNIAPEQPSTYHAASRLLALSDIEGNFKGLKMMLQGAAIVDENLNWTFGDGHLVLLGDYFDRGLNVTECLWLLYKLEAEAEAVGGKVHFIIGNHEVLNLQGNTLYVRKKYLENARLIGEEYRRWYDANSELGRWLRSKNAVERIGDYVFCHGGISPALVRTGMSLDEINRVSRQNLGKLPDTSGQSHVRAVFDMKTGIFWYRDAAKNMLSIDEVKDILAFAGAKRMVVGHTLQPDLVALYGGRVLCIDLYHEENIRQGFMKTLWMEDGYCYALDSRGGKSSVFSIAFPRKSD
jgi:hypothetical protein